MARIGKALVLAGLLASPGIVHLALWLGWPPAVAAVAVGVQLAALAAALLARAQVRHRGAVALSAAALLMVLAWHFGAHGLAVSSGVPHAIMHTVLLALFGASLWPGREPLVTRVIAHIRGPLPDELIRYGRHVTIAWCCYFAAQLAVSATLLLTAPLTVWSFFINVLNLPLLFAMFAAEYAYRRVRFRHLPKSRLKDMIKVLARGGIVLPRSRGGAM